MKRSGIKVMGRLVGLVKPLTGFMCLAIFMGVLGNLCATGITVLGGYAVTGFLGFQMPVSLGWLFGLLGIFALVRGVLRYGEQGCNHYIAFKLLALIRDKVFAALRKLTPAKLEGRDKGDLISLITSDIELLEVFYAHTVSPVLIAVIFSALMSLFIGSFHWTLGLLALGAYVTVGALVPVVISRRSGNRGLEFRSQSGELSGYILDSLRGLNEILQYGRGRERLAEMDRRSRDLVDKDGELKKQAARGSASVGSLLIFFDFVMLFGAGALYSLGKVRADGVLIPTIAMMSSFGPVVSLASLGGTLQYTFAAGNRVLDILDEEPVTEEISGRAKTEFSGASASHVDFSYDREQVLKDFSVEIKKGSVTGIMGRSGSGKSTFLKLLMRFWKCQGGRVEISGRDVNDINTEDLRNMESFVTQETHLFKDTILNNLLIARQNATREQVEAACRKASVHDFIMSLPKGYDTDVGELGDTLSGGERQRLGLARAFLHDADLMLLDEPTSNLDSLNEAVILKSLHEERENRTVVLVSHRKSTMTIADKVCSVENGRVS